MNRINLKEELLKITDKNKQIEFAIKCFNPIVKKISNKISRKFNSSNYEDLCQEANIIIALNLHKILENKIINNVEGYLIMIIKNHFCKLLKEDKRVKNISNPIEEGGSSGIVGYVNVESTDSNLCKLIDCESIKNIKKLIYNSKSPLIIKIFDLLLTGCEFVEIADNLNLSVQAILNIINRKIKPVIKKYLEEQ